MTSWDWVHEWNRQAHAKGDAERLRLYAFFFHGMQQRILNPPTAISLFDQARAIAVHLNECWWVLMCDHWKIEVLRWYEGDLCAALGLVVRTALESRKPIYAGSPQRAHVHANLVGIYVNIDPCGYQTRIQEALNYLKEDSTSYDEVRFGIQEVQCDFAIEKERSCGDGDWQEAHDFAIAYGALAQNGKTQHRRNHYSSNALYRLCMVAHQRQSWNEMFEYSKSGEECARQNKNELHLVELLMWRALAERHLKTENEASLSYRGALQIAASLGATPWPEYFDASCAFHELKGDLNLSLQTRESQLERLQNKGQNALEARAQKHRCQLLGELGRLTKADLETARTVSKRLIFPEKTLQQLDELAIEYSME